MIFKKKLVKNQEYLAIGEYSLILANLNFLLDDNDYLIIVIWSCLDNVRNDNARTQRRTI